MGTSLSDIDFSEWVVSLRRHFHQYPELSNSEVKTQEKLMIELELLGIECHEIAGTGVIGTIKGGQQGKTIALRADIDALRIQEQYTSINKVYISKNNGIMHACGHDGHMAMVLGAARLLQEIRHKLKGNVKLIFQPAEEIPPGGAIEVIKEKGLKGVDAILGIHLFPNYESGRICFNKGAMMASNCKFEITITGKSGHHFNADACMDPISMGAEFISIIRNEIREILPQSARYVFEIGTIHGGDQFNQIPDMLTISGSYRVLDIEQIPKIEQTIRQVLDFIISKHRKENSENLPQYRLTIVEGYPVLKNNPVFTNAAINIFKNHSMQIEEDIRPVMASDDFAYYLNEVPGIFLFLGTRNIQKGLTNELHSNCFDFDEKILHTGVEVLFMLVCDFLEEPLKYLIN